MIAVWAAYLFGSISSFAAISAAMTVIFFIQQTKLLRHEVTILQEQTQGAVDASRAENNARLREVMLKINDVFLQKPGIRKFFYDGVPIDSHCSDFAYAETAAEHLLDIMEHLLWQADNFPSLYGINEKSEKAFWRICDETIQDLSRKSFLTETVCYAESSEPLHIPNGLLHRGIT